MKLLLDHDVYAVTARWLASQGHDVVTANTAGLASASDREVLAAARRDARVLVTRDRDYGSLVFLEGRSGGVVYLRISPATLDAVHDELATVFQRYTPDLLAHSFVVVEPGRHRVRRSPGERRPTEP
jgi:predicted nuclease of predicted toxin-antitoxin system